MTEWSNVSDRNSDGSNTYGGSNPPAAPFYQVTLDPSWHSEYELCTVLQHSGSDELFYYNVPNVVARRLTLPAYTRLSWVVIPKPTQSRWHTDTRSQPVINYYVHAGNGVTEFGNGSSFVAQDNEAWWLDVGQMHRVTAPAIRRFLQIELA